MNEKQCYNVLSEFLDQIEKQYSLEKGSYRITFYVKLDLMICFSVILKDKSRAKLDRNMLLTYLDNRDAKVFFSFDYNMYVKCYFKNNVNQFNQLNSIDKTVLVVEALNEIYLDQAVIPTQLL